MRSYVRSAVGFLAVLLVVYSSARLTTADVVHVAASGNDANPGTVDQPVRSLHHAIQLTRSTPGSDTIEIAPGTLLRLPSTITLDARDNGLAITCPRGTAVVSGGEQVTNWTVGSDGNWRAPCPVPGVPRELFVNGKRATRARFPNGGYLRIEKTLADRRSGFTVGQQDLPQQVSVRKGLELVFLHDWSISRVPVASIDRDTHILRATAPIGCSSAHFAIDHFEPHPRYFLEGTRELVDMPGEWCVDDGTIIYRPLPGETPNQAGAFVPRLTELFRIEPGADKQSPSRIRFEGVSFEHCRFDLPAQGYAAGQATMYEARQGTPWGARTFVPAAVRVTGASEVEFNKCAFQRLGGSGVWIGAGSRDCMLRNCKVFDVSGNGINIGEPTTDNVAQRVSISNSTVSHCGRQFFGSVGIWIGMAEACSVQSCQVFELPYTGISVGWRWNPTPSPCQNHRIVDNDIHHVMLTLSDGGGIYTLGRQPGTVLAHNHIHDVPRNAGRAQSNGIFMDEGTTDLVVERNLIHGIAMSPIRFHKAGENTIRNNVLGISPDLTAFTFNATDAKVIRSEHNREIPEDSSDLEAAVREWQEDDRD